MYSFFFFTFIIVSSITILDNRRLKETLCLIPLLVLIGSVSQMGSYSCFSRCVVVQIFNKFDSFWRVFLLYGLLLLPIKNRICILLHVVLNSCSWRFSVFIPSLERSLRGCFPLGLVNIPRCQSNLNFRRMFFHLNYSFVFWSPPSWYFQITKYLRKFTSKC